ncbi:hypothetical protein ACPA9J_10375 [Pseudomonas aeruginosa]
MQPSPWSTGRSPDRADCSRPADQSLGTDARHVAGLDRRGVQGMPELNRARLQATGLPPGRVHRRQHRREINLRCPAVGLAPAVGGQLIYQPPVDLALAEVRMQNPAPMCARRDGADDAGAQLALRSLAPERSRREYRPPIPRAALAWASDSLRRGRDIPRWHGPPLPQWAESLQGAVGRSAMDGHRRAMGAGDRG